MLKNLLSAFIGAKIEQRAGHPMTGAVVAFTAMAVAKRSLPIAIGLTIALVAFGIASRNRAEVKALPAY